MQRPLSPIFWPPGGSAAESGDYRIGPGATRTQLYLTMLLILFLSPLPPRSPREWKGLPFSFRNLGCWPDPGRGYFEFIFYVDLQNNRVSKLWDPCPPSVCKGPGELRSHLKIRCRSTSQIRQRRCRTVLKVETTNEIRLPPGSGPKSPDALRKVTVRTLPRTPRGEGGQEQIKKRP